MHDADRIVNGLKSVYQQSLVHRISYIDMHALRKQFMTIRETNGMKDRERLRDYAARFRAHTMSQVNVYKKLSFSVRRKLVLSGAKWLITAR